MDIGKKGWLLKKLKKREKRAVLCLSCSLSIWWVSAGLARPATAAAAAAATEAATFIDRINLAVLPVSLSIWRLLRTDTQFVGAFPDWDAFETKFADRFGIELTPDARGTQAETLYIRDGELCRNFIY